MELPVSAERLAQLELFARRRGKGTAEALDEALPSTWIRNVRTTPKPSMVSANVVVSRGGQLPHIVEGECRVQAAGGQIPASRGVNDCPPPSWALALTHRATKPLTAGRIGRGRSAPRLRRARRTAAGREARRSSAPRPEPESRGWSHSRRRAGTHGPATRHNPAVVQHLDIVARRGIRPTVDDGVDVGGIGGSCEASRPDFDM